MRLEYGERLLTVGVVVHRVAYQNAIGITARCGAFLGFSHARREQINAVTASFWEHVTCPKCRDPAAPWPEEVRKS